MTCRRMTGLKGSGLERDRMFKKLPQVRAVELEVHKVFFCPAMTCSTHVIFVYSFYYQGM